MKNYIEKLIKNKVPLNSGYFYVATENIAIPVHRAVLGVSKRRTSNLELVEEMVLRIVSIGINDIDMIAGILGLPREILDISVGDLHVKNLAYHTSGKCILLASGKESLKALSVSKREKDVLDNVYINAVTGEISGERNKDYTERIIRNDEKMKHVIDATSIDLYRRNVSDIKPIFEQAMKEYLDNKLQIPDELVSIDSVDDLYTGYIVAPIHIYISENGSDIDISPRNRWQKGLIENHKQIIIEQMRNRKLLHNLFLNTCVEHLAPTSINGLSCEDQYSTIQVLLSNDDIDGFDDKVRELLFRPRKLFDNELIDFCELIFKEASSVEIQIDNLNYWSKNSKFLTIGSFITPNTKCSIFYKTSAQDTKRLIKRIHGSCPNISQTEILKGEHSSWLSLLINSKVKIDVYSKLFKVFYDNQYIPYLSAYVSSY